jgi:hypothetical protein
MLPTNQYEGVLIRTFSVLSLDVHKKEYVSIYQNDLDLIEQGKGSNRIEAKIVGVLSKLKSNQ